MKKFSKNKLGGILSGILSGHEKYVNELHTKDELFKIHETVSKENGVQVASSYKILTSIYFDHLKNTVQEGSNNIGACKSLKFRRIGFQHIHKESVKIGWGLEDGNSYEMKDMIFNDKESCLKRIDELYELYLDSRVVKESEVHVISI